MFFVFQLFQLFAKFKRKQLKKSKKNGAPNFLIFFNYFNYCQFYKEPIEIINKIGAPNCFQFLIFFELFANSRRKQLKLKNKKSELPNFSLFSLF